MLFKPFHTWCVLPLLSWYSQSETKSPPWTNLRTQKVFLAHLISSFFYTTLNTNSLLSLNNSFHSCTVHMQQHTRADCTVHMQQHTRADWKQTWRVIQASKRPLHRNLPISRLKLCTARCLEQCTFYMYINIYINICTLYNVHCKVMLQCTFWLLLPSVIDGSV